MYGKGICLCILKERVYTLHLVFKFWFCGEGSAARTTDIQLFAVFRPEGVKNAYLKYL